MRAESPEAARAEGRGGSGEWESPADLAAAFLADQVPGVAVSTRVHPDDGMLDFFLGEDHGLRDLALADYLRTGLAAHQVLGRLLARHFGALAKVPSLLDFASGFGRVTRFLVTEVPAERVWVAEIEPEAAAFQEAAFGVHGLPAGTDPAGFDPGRRFAAVVSASLFTHLPRASFFPWLAKLLGLVESGGILLASVHDAAAMLPGRTLPADGFYFERMSESRHLDLEQYGSTWVSEAFMADALARASGGRAAYRRFPRGLWHSQDLYAVSPDGGADLSALDLDRGPEGFLEECEPLPDGRLRLAGWAVDRGRGGAPPTAGSVPSVRALLDGRLAGEARADLPRADLPPDDRSPDDLAGDERGGSPAQGGRAAGWQLVLGTPGRPLAPGGLLLVKAVSASGRELVLHLGSVAATPAVLALTRAQRLLREVSYDLSFARSEQQIAHRLAVDRGWSLHQLEARLATMEASRFWKLRNAWFRAKRLLGLTREG